MKTSEVLRAAKAKIATPETWTKDASAVDAEGRPVMAGSERAVCRCATGATDAADPEDRGYGADEYLAKVAQALYADRCAVFESDGECVVNFNDHGDTTHDDVMRVFDIAIADAETDEAHGA